MSCNGRASYAENGKGTTQWSTDFVDCRSRNISTSSQQSLISDTLLLCSSPAYDSGNFSYSPSRSDGSAHPSPCLSEEDNSTVSTCNSIIICETKLKFDRNDGNTATFRQIDHLKSELERYKKSEEWYKKELKAQKKSKLDLLEKLYLTERKYVNENQKLRDEFAAAHLLYEEDQRRATREKDDLIKQMQDLQLVVSKKFSENSSFPNEFVEHLKFDLQKQKSTIAEQEQIVEILRNQKQILLNDLTSLSSEKDATIARLEASLLLLEQENRKITQKCSETIRKNILLEQELKEKLIVFNNFKSLKEKTDNQLKILKSELSENKLQLSDYINKVSEIEYEFASKRNECDDLKLSLAEQTKTNQNLQSKIESYQKLTRNNGDEANFTDKGDRISCKLIDNPVIVCQTQRSSLEISHISPKKGREVKPIIAVKPRRNELEIEKPELEKQRASSLANIIKDKYGCQLDKTTENLEEDKICLKQNYVPNILLENSIDISNYNLPQFVTNDFNFQNKFFQDAILKKNPQVDSTHSISEVNNFKSRINGLYNEIRRLKIFRNVLEHEHRREISRYELYIGTLLKNVKSNKKALECAQTRIRQLQKLENLPKISVSTNTEIFENVYNKEEIPQTQSSEKIVVDEEIKRVERDEILKNSGASQIKDSQTEIDGVLRRNLMDDYKRMIRRKEIQNSLTSSSLVAIDELIKKSNSYVPNFDSLANSIDDLKNDLRMLKANSGRCVSLMDELRAVDEAMAN